MTLAVVYTRVSSAPQEQNYSLATQREGCDAYAARHGYTVSAHFEEVFTATQMDRPQLNRLFDYVSDNPVDVVIIYDVDRFSRQFAENAILEYQLEQQGVRIEYVLDSHDNTPEGALTRQIKSAIAEYENRQRVRRAMRGKDGRVRSGNVLVSYTRTPYGYDYVSKPHGGTLVINEAEAKHVRQMFAWAVEGHSGRAIARMLSEQGVLTRGDTRSQVHKRAGRCQWAGATVLNILRSTTYKGEWQFRKVRSQKKRGVVTHERTAPEERITAPVPAIIDGTTWEAAQVMLKRTKSKAQRNAKRDYLLRSLVYCQCGRRWVGVYKPYLQRGYYRCRAAETDPHLNVCAIPGGVRQDRLEDAVWEKVAAVLLDPAMLRIELQRRQTQAQQTLARHHQRLAAIASAQEDVKRKLGIMLDSVLVEGFPPDLIEERKRLLLRQQEELAQQQEQVHAEIEAYVLTPAQEESVLAFAERLSAGLTELSFAAKRQVLDMLQVRVDVVSQEEFTVTALIPVGDGSVIVPRLERAASRKQRTGGAAKPAGKGGKGAQSGPADDGTLDDISSRQNSLET